MPCCSTDYDLGTATLTSSQTDQWPVGGIRVYPLMLLLPMHVRTWLWGTSSSD